MDTIDSEPITNPGDAKEGARKEEAVNEEDGPEAVLRLRLTPLAAVFKHGASVASASAALVAATGVLIAGPSFARAGVPFAKLPLLLLTSAGLNFVMTTTGALYLGLIAGFAKTRMLSVGVVGVGLVFYFVNFTEHAGLSLWLLVYVVILVVVGLFLRRAPRVLGSEHRSIWVLAAMALLLSYYVLAYPSVPAAVGGGRPKPVRIAWIERPWEIPASRSIYEVFRDEGFIYLAVEPDEQTGLLDRLVRQNFSNRATFVAVPITQIRFIVYLPWVKSFDHLPDWDPGFAAPSIHLSDAGKDGGVVEGSRTSTTAEGAAADGSAARAELASIDGGSVNR